MTLVNVDFEATPSEKDKLEAWCLKEHGAILQAKGLDLFVTSPSQNPAEKKGYKAGLPKDFRLSAPQWVLDLIVIR